MEERRMNNPPSPLKQEFLDKWIKGLQTYNNFNTKMSILERKKAIKLSADVAIASTRNNTTGWSRAVLMNAANKTFKQTSAHMIEQPNVSMIKRSNKFLRRSRRTVMAAKQKAKARRGGRLRPSVQMRRVSMAKKMVKKRTRVLKRLVPGGEGMEDEACLIRETLDYIASLRVQVDVMRLLAGMTSQ